MPVIDPTTISSWLVIRPFPKELGYENWIRSYVVNLGPMRRVALSPILTETALPKLDLLGVFYKIHNLTLLLDKTLEYLDKEYPGAEQPGMRLEPFGVEPMAFKASNRTGGVDFLYDERQGIYYADLAQWL